MIITNELEELAKTKDKEEYFDCLIKLINQTTGENIIKEECKFPKTSEVKFENLEMWKPSKNDRETEGTIHYFKDAICIIFPKGELINSIKLKGSFNIKKDRRGDYWIGFRKVNELKEFIQFLNRQGYKFGKSENSNIKTNSHKNVNSFVKHMDEKKYMFSILKKIFTPNHPQEYKGDKDSIYIHTKNDNFIVDYVDTTKRKECKVKINNGKEVLFEAYATRNGYYICTEKEYYDELNINSKYITSFHKKWDKQLKIENLDEKDFIDVCNIFKSRFESNNARVVKKRVVSNKVKKLDDDEQADQEINKAVEENNLGLTYVENYKPKIEKQKNSKGVYKRSPIVANNALFKANQKCFLNEDHQSFTRKDGMIYLEVHHIIPMKAQGDYKEALDREENVVCLCPNCHRKIHYGKDKYEMIEELFKSRKKDIEKCGINISFNSLYSYYK